MDDLVQTEELASTDKLVHFVVGSGPTYSPTSTSSCSEGVSLIDASVSNLINKLLNWSSEHRGRRGRRRRWRSRKGWGMCHGKKVKVATDAGDLGEAGSLQAHRDLHLRRGCHSQPARRKLAHLRLPHFIPFQRFSSREGSPVCGAEEALRHQRPQGSVCPSGQVCKELFLVTGMIAQMNDDKFGSAMVYSSVEK